MVNVVLITRSIPFTILFFGNFQQIKFAENLLTIAIHSQLGLSNMLAHYF